MLQTNKQNGPSMAEFTAGGSPGSRTQIEQGGAVRVKERQGSERRGSWEDGPVKAQTQCLESLGEDNTSKGSRPLNGKISTTNPTPPNGWAYLFYIKNEQ